MLFGKWLTFSLILALGVGILALPQTVTAERGLPIDEGLDELAWKLADSLNPGADMTIAVADFQDLEGHITGFGRYVALQMPERLRAVSDKITIIEWGSLGKVLEELCFNQTDLFDRGLAKKFGRFLGADAILVGTITDQGESVWINARIMSTEVRRSLAVASITVARGDRVARLLGVALEPMPPLDKKCQETVRRPVDNTLQYEPVKDELIFENDLIRVTVKSFTRFPRKLVLEVWYENLTEYVMKLWPSHWGRAHRPDHPGTYLLGNDGEKWLFRDDTRLGHHYQGVELIPHQRLLNTITFVPERRNRGSEFTYVGKYRIRWINSGRSQRKQDFQVIIRDLQPVERMEYR